MCMKMRMCHIDVGRSAQRFRIISRRRRRGPVKSGCTGSSGNRRVDGLLPHGDPKRISGIRPVSQNSELLPNFHSAFGRSASLGFGRAFSGALFAGMQRQGTPFELDRPPWRRFEHADIQHVGTWRSSSGENVECSTVFLRERVRLRFGSLKSDSPSIAPMLSSSTGGR